MEKKQDSITQIKNLEKLMISDIVDGYFICKNFFSLNTTYHDHKQNILKNDLLKRLSHSFYSKYSNHPSVLSDSNAEINLVKRNRVTIKIKEGGFPFPYSFVRYMDRLQDINIIPVKITDLTIIDNYMTNFSVLENLDEFLLGFFLVLKKLSFPMRERDVEMLKILTNPFLLQKTAKGKPRIHPPDMTELVQVLEYDKNQINRVTRAYRFLYKFRIAFVNMILMNPAKFGFFIAYFEYFKENKESVEELKPFILWKIPFKDHFLAIACVPLGNINELLNPFDFTQLTSWNWNFNFDSFTYNKSETLKGWDNFQIPDFQSKTFVYSDFVKWDLTSSYKDEFNENEIEIIKNLTNTSISTHNLDILSKKVSSGGIRYILSNFVDNGLYQLYPHVNHLGIKEIIVLKIICQDKDYFQSLIHNLMTLPICHVLSNEKENLIISYFHIPKNYIEDLTDKLHLLAVLLGEEISLEYELLPKTKTIFRVPQIKGINFAIRNGIAYLSD